jgi:peptidoglycan/LPS O-acetylase OafA/YrhL
MKNLRFHEVDLLRFMAALSVLIFHYTYRGPLMGLLGGVDFPAIAAFTKYGYLGVHLFFLISGFVILVTADGKTPRKFVTSRIVRLYPTYWCCLTISFLAILFFGRDRFSAGTGQYVANLTMLNSFAGIESIDGVYWSLAVEMKFYLLVFLLVAFGQIGRVKHYLGLWLALTLWLLHHHMPVLGGLLIAQHAGCFIGGATFYLIAKEGNSFYKTALLVGSFYVAQARAVQATIEAVDGVNSLGQPLVIILILGAFYLLMYLVATRKTARFGLKKFAGLGALTYPLYLLHQNIGYLVIAKFGTRVERHVLLIGLTGLMIAASWSVHRLIELRYGPRLKAFLDGVRWPRQSPVADASVAA